MATNQKSSKTQPAHKRVTTLEIIDMFRALNLPVTDDGQQIESKAGDLQKRYLREKGSPDPQKRNKADLWFKNVERLKKDRPALLDIVSKHFSQLADTALEAAQSSGIKELTPRLVEQLKRLAETQCNCDPTLAQKFVEDYMVAGDLEVGKVFVRPGVVENFTAISEMGQISLNWSLPPSNWDEIEIIREVESSTSDQDNAASETIYCGRDTFFLDTGVVPGTRYRYRAHSIFQGVSSTDNVQRAVCLGEVRNIQATYKEGKISLRWELPGEGVSVVIFRRSDSAPSIRQGPHGLEPADEATEQIYPQQSTLLKDHRIIEDHTYYYRIVADYGQGLFTQGKDVQVNVPRLPPAVLNATAVYKPGAGKDEVLIEWQAVKSEMSMEYVVVRREGSIPPGRIDVGDVVGTTRDTRYPDQEVVVGHRYTYAVFSRIGELDGLTGTATQSVDILAEVTDLRAITGDQTVELSWNTPANVSRVIVRQGQTPPRDHTDGKLIPLTGRDNAKDKGLHNGQGYHYLVCCAYRPDGMTEIFSSGVRIEAVPDRLPTLVKDFTAYEENREVVCMWTPPEHGQVVVIRSANPHELTLGQRLSVEEVDELGERIATESGYARDASPDINKPYYSAFTIAGSQAIAGGTGCVVVCPDVTDLKLSATRDGVILRWVWPPGCTMVRITRCQDTWPQGPEDLQATKFSCSRTEYREAGEKFVDTIQQERGQFYYIVYARASGVPGQFFASGIEPGSRAVIQWEPWMTLGYQLSWSKKRRKGRDIRVTWSIKKPFPNFAGFLLIANETRPPLSADDGIEIFRWTPEEQAEDSFEARISLTPIQQRNWAHFFCKAFVIDAAQSHTTLIIHPNTCIPFLTQVEAQRSRQEKAKPAHRFGVPKTVICPYCFEEFPINQILFDSFAGGEALPAHYNWLDRLFHRPPQPPKNAQGQRLTRKLCPNHHHVLPFTAGTQASLVIGVIGAKFSGKSHYIAALIERLAGQVGANFQASLLPVTDETAQRYQREFYDPLFEKSLELPVTVGTPPPLIYDLYFDGKLWGEKRNRAVTLALYDTAGENFDDPNTVRQMVQYLRVASGIIFLIDPLQAPGVREALPSSVPLPDVSKMAEPNMVISRVLTELENGKVVTQSGPLSTPVAVVLTKCDVLRDSGLIEANRLWSGDKGHVGYFDSQAHDDMTGMMGEYMLRWSLKAYNTVKTRFSRHAFFGVSSTGCASDKTTRRYKYVSPRRVEEPLLWLLAELGGIPTR